MDRVVVRWKELRGSGINGGDRSPGMVGHVSIFVIN